VRAAAYRQDANDARGDAERQQAALTAEASRALVHGDVLIPCAPTAQRLRVLIESNWDKDLADARETSAEQAVVVPCIAALDGAPPDTDVPVVPAQRAAERAGSFSPWHARGGRPPAPTPTTRPWGRAVYRARIRCRRENVRTPADARDAPGRRPRRGC
jgi:hypothetical protein